MKKLLLLDYFLSMQVVVVEAEAYGLVSSEARKSRNRIVYPNKKTFKNLHNDASLLC